MPAPERRTRRDLVVAAAIVVVVALAAGALWAGSDARATDSETATTPATPLAPSPALPAALVTAYSLPSGASTRPGVAAGAVVAADGGTVTGHDPVTGAPLWRYARDLPLCAEAVQWSHAVAVYRDGRGCSQVTALRGADGARGPQRSSDADDEVSQLGDGTYLTSVGDTRLEVWRSDLVRTTELGRVDAPVNPSSQPRTGCELRSTGTTNGRVVVVERCPGDDSERLTTIASAPSDAEKPQEFGSVLLGVEGARVVAVTGDRAAVLLPGDVPRLVVYDGQGAVLAEHPVPGLGVPARPAGRTEATTSTGTLTTWWTGGATVALSKADLAPLWTLPTTLGPGVAAGAAMDVPVPGGIAVVDTATGAVQRTTAVDRGSYDPATDGPVTSETAGDTWLEQRGGLVVGLRAP
ncbi:Rv3212 family protein [Rhodococcus aerolatus]